VALLLNRVAFGGILKARMEKTIINPPALAAPKGFNHGILVSGGKLLFLAGQDASDGVGQIVAPGDLVAQTEQVLRNLRAVVEAAGGGMQDIVKLNVFVADRAAYRASRKPLGQLFRTYFGEYYPTMALFEVAAFFQDEALIELEGFAVIAEA
jgi:enamine deaminase RidA (YjgF/YER057c/UK114 family)